jgi:tetratricopeptide (TPR) repeat protein
MKFVYLGVIACGVAAGLVSQTQCARKSGGSNPELIHLVLTSGSPLVRDQVQKAYDQAQQYPKNAAANGELGKVLQAYEQYGSAETAYRRARSLDPGAFEWFYYLGMVQSAQAKYTEAAASFRGALGLRADDPDARLRLADCLLSLGRLRESGDEYRQVLRQNPERANAHYGLGRVLDATGQAAAAIKSYSKACELFPAYAAAHYALAMSYRKSGWEDQAREHLALYQQHSTSVPPSDDVLLAAVAELNRSTNDLVWKAALEAPERLREVIEVHERALRLEPSNNSALVNLVTLYSHAGEFDKGRAAYAAALAINPNQAPLHNSYGVLLLQSRNDAEAERAFRKALQIDPQFVPGYESLGFLAEQRGRKMEALELYGRATAIEPSYRPARFRLGRLLLSLKRYPEAQEQFLRLVTPAADQTKMLTDIAHCYVEAGRLEATHRFATQAHSTAAASGQKDLARAITVLFGSEAAPL